MTTTLLFSRILSDGFSANCRISSGGFSGAVVAGLTDYWTRAGKYSGAPDAPPYDLVACPGKESAAPNYGMWGYCLMALNRFLRTTRMCSRKMFCGCMGMFTGDALLHCLPGLYDESLQPKVVGQQQRQLRPQCRPLALPHHRCLHQVHQWWCRLVAPVVWGECGGYLGNQAQQCSEHLTGALLPQQIVEA